MIGLVLSGGKSVRMGTDKGLLEHDGLSWTKLAFDKLRAQIPTVYISVSQVQKETYSAHFEQKYLLPDNDSIAVGGPLLGLLSAHVLHPEENMMVLACDMVKMEQEPMNYLVKQFHHYPEMDACLFFNDNGMQPLMAIYHRTLLAKIYQQAIQASLEKFSMKHLADISRCFKIAVPARWANYFFNFNTHEDLQRFVDSQQ